MVQQTVKRIATVLGVHHPWDVGFNRVATVLCFYCNVISLLNAFRYHYYAIMG